MFTFRSVVLSAFVLAAGAVRAESDDKEVMIFIRHEHQESRFFENFVAKMEELNPNKRVVRLEKSGYDSDFAKLEGVLHPDELVSDVHIITRRMSIEKDIHGDERLWLLGNVLYHSNTVEAGTRSWQHAMFKGIRGRLVAGARVGLYVNRFPNEVSDRFDSEEAARLLRSGLGLSDGQIFVGTRDFSPGKEFVCSLGAHLGCVGGIAASAVWAPDFVWGLLALYLLLPNETRVGRRVGDYLMPGQLFSFAHGKLVSGQKQLRRDYQNSVIKSCKNRLVGEG